MLLVSQLLQLESFIYIIHKLSYYKPRRVNIYPSGNTEVDLR